MSRLFGTDGVRGVFGEELTTELAFDLGKYGSVVLSRGADAPTIVIGMDTRESGSPLEEALIQGITSVGGKVLLAGVIPTPAVAVITRVLKADAGIVISASHNPYQFNGIKFFSGQGFKLPDAVEDEIEALIREQAEIKTQKTGSVERITEPEKIYLEAISIGLNKDLSGLKLYLDCANGASAAIAPAFFESLGAQVTAIGTEPDGQNINKDCGSTCLDVLCEKMAAGDADLGLAFDGDADRCLAVDNQGRVIDGDAIMYLIAAEMQSKGTLKQNTVVVTVMSNIGLDRALEPKDIHTVKTKVGDRYVLEEMLASDYNIGGEQSGHVILLDHNTTGDGILTALCLANIVRSSDVDSAALNDQMISFPQALVNAKVSNAKKQDYRNDPVIQEEISKVEAHFAGNGRVLIRPSGTEPLVRVMIEGEDQAELEQIAENLAKLIEYRLA